MASNRPAVPDKNKRSVAEFHPAGAKAEVHPASCPFHVRRVREPCCPRFVLNVGSFEGTIVLRLAVLFLILGLVAGILGFTGIAGASFAIAKFLFFIFLVIFLVFLVLGLAAARTLTGD